MDIRLTVDIVIFTILKGELQILLVKRGIPPFQGKWAIPGGFVLEAESLEDAARRELIEETGVADVYFEQLYSFGDPKRDPRGRVVTVAYFALISADAVRVRGGSDAAEARWHAVKLLPPLAFDHAKILDYAVERLRNKLEYTTVGFQFLPREFTLSELQRVYEVILNKRLDKRNFRRKIGLLGIVRATGRSKSDGRRPAKLYSFVARKFEKLKDKGILFPF
jgi:8-oxo-dGTP diphosphatase